MEESFLKRQVIPIILTAVVCGFLILFLWGEVVVLNSFTREDIFLQIRWADVLIGLTIYIKTAIDFAIFIGRLIDQHPGWKNRVAIEIGTAFGNAIGTLLVLALWVFFRQIRWLLALMIFIAALVLLKLAEDSFRLIKKPTYPRWFLRLAQFFDQLLEVVNRWTSPLLRYIIPDLQGKESRGAGFLSLFLFSFSIPFVLGLDDFAGYVPLFNIVNVFGFSIGVFLGHMLLNAFLYIHPKTTIRVVKNDIVSFLGGLVFIGLALWGLIEVFELFVV